MTSGLLSQLFSTNIISSGLNELGETMAGLTGVWGRLFGARQNSGDSGVSGISGHVNSEGMNGTYSGISGTISGASDLGTSDQGAFQLLGATFESFSGFAGNAGLLGASDFWGFSGALSGSGGYLDLIGILFCIGGWFCSLLLLFRMHGFHFQNDWWDLEARQKSEILVKPLQLYPTDMLD